MEKEYEFDTEDGKKTLAELFDGRSQLLAYNIMFGPDYEVGACPGCSNLGDELDATRVHLNHRDVTLICFSRAPIDRLIAYKERMGWTFPYVSTYGTDFPFDFGLALTPEQAQQIPEVKEMIDDPPEWLEEWAEQVGAKLEDGLREGPGFIAFARENGTVFHTYTVTAPDPFVAPYHSFLLDRTPKPQPEEPRAWRKDEYPAPSADGGPTSWRRRRCARVGRGDAPRPRRGEAGLVALLLALADGGVGAHRRRMARHGRRAGGELGDVGRFAISWLLMMAAMMPPAISPMVVAYGRRAAPAAARPAFAAGYLAPGSPPGSSPTRPSRVCARSSSGSSPGRGGPSWPLQ